MIDRTACSTSWEASRLGRKESGKPIGEIGVARVEPQRHGEPLG